MIHENSCEALWITRQLEGDYVEIGVYLGGSALTAINFLDEMEAGCHLRHQRKAWLLDTYDGFNYDEAYASSDAMWAGTHLLFGKEKTIAYIEETLVGTRVVRKMVAGNICSDAIPLEVRKIAVANIHVDMYEPTLAALCKVADLVVSGLLPQPCTARCWRWRSSWFQSKGPLSTRFSKAASIFLSSVSAV